VNAPGRWPWRALGALLFLLTTSSVRAGAQESYEARSGLLQLEGLVVFFSGAGPLSYVTMTARDVPADAVRIGSVAGRGCQFGVSTPFMGTGTPQLSGGGGEGGFARAVEDIRRRHPDLRGIYDVKVDDHVMSILTVFQRQCTEVAAQGFR
jgi:hypothetical protein